MLKRIAVVVCVVGMALGLAGDATAKDDKPKKGSGPDAFRESVMACLVAGVTTGNPDMVQIADECVRSVRVVWEASYPELWGATWPNWNTD